MADFFYQIKVRKPMGSLFKYSRVMLKSFSRPIQWYHSHVDPIWPDGTFNVKTTLYLAVLLVCGRGDEGVDRGDDCGGGYDGRSLFSRHRSWGLSALWLRRGIIL